MNGDLVRSIGECAEFEREESVKKAKFVTPKSRQENIFSFLDFFSFVMNIRPSIITQVHKYKLAIELRIDGPLKINCVQTD